MARIKQDIRANKQPNKIPDTKRNELAELMQHNVIVS